MWAVGTSNLPGLALNLRWLVNPWNLGTWEEMNRHNAFRINAPGNFLGQLLPTYINVQSLRSGITLGLLTHSS
jgi:hypothetical protein